MLTDRSNDYSPLEASYRAASGGELIAEPYDSFDRSPAMSKSATVLIGTCNSASTLQKSLLSLDASTFKRDVELQGRRS